MSRVVTDNANNVQYRRLRSPIYLRISQDREMDGLAIDLQREGCEELAWFRRWDVVETYVDQTKSATDRTKNRLDYDRMVADCQERMFEAIICYDLDRLTRQPRQLEDWIDDAEIRALALVTVNGDAGLGTEEINRLSAPAQAHARRRY